MLIPLSLSGDIVYHHSPLQLGSFVFFDDHELSADDNLLCVIIPMSTKRILIIGVNGNVISARPNLGAYHYHESYGIELLNNHVSIEQRTKTGICRSLLTELY